MNVKNTFFNLSSCSQEPVRRSNTVSCAREFHFEEIVDVCASPASIDASTLDISDLADECSDAESVDCDISESTKVMIHGLPNKVTQESLLEIVQQRFENVNTVLVPMHRASKGKKLYRNRGFAFIEFISRDASETFFENFESFVSDLGTSKKLTLVYA
jgi:RNA recognition motif-containing protein